eukprot:1026346-Pyramimonas_sp.AAC.1
MLPGMVPRPRADQLSEAVVRDAQVGAVYGGGGAAAGVEAPQVRARQPRRLPRLRLRPPQEEEEHA